jgi:uncharacterized membrane protein HdeD (DUF308 family)
MNVPSSVGVVVVALFLGLNGIALAHRLLWRRSPALFWLASTLIVVGIGYIVATGSAENVARSLWPVPFDPVKTEEFKLRAPCEAPRLLGISLILSPVLLVVPFLLYKFWRRPWPVILFSACFTLLYFFLYLSPIPEKVARVVFSEDVLKVPDHCRQPNP